MTDAAFTAIKNELKWIIDQVRMELQHKGEGKLAAKLFRFKVNIALVIISRISDLQPRRGLVLVEWLPRLLVDPLEIVERETSAYSNECPVVSEEGGWLVRRSIKKAPGLEIKRGRKGRRNLHS
jgi:hypothetical protein